MTGPLHRRRRGHHVDLDRVDLTVLALRAGTGDEEAIAAFVRRTMPDVWRYCAHVLSVELADDAVQATYLRALRSLQRFRGDAGALTWLIGVARNVCLDEMRSWGRRDRLATRLRSQPIEVSVGFDGHRAELGEALAMLAPERHEAFVLTQLLGFSYEETAQIAGCPIGTIRSRVSRARTDLVAHLDAGEDPGRRTEGA